MTELNKGLIQKCETMMNPPVGDIDIGDDGTWNVGINQMVIDQWYSFEDAMGTTVYLKLDKDQLLIQTTDEPKTTLHSNGKND